MENPPKPTRTSTNKIGAGAAGAGGGTLLVLLANNLPDHSPYKPWLLLLAPSVSVSFSALLLWTKTRIEFYIFQRQFNSLIRNAKATLQEALKNPDTSVEHKQQLRKDLEDLESLNVQTQLARIKFLTRSQ